MLGQGTFGCVYPEIPGVVVKRLRRTVASHPHAVLVEAWLLHKCRHPHVVRGLGVRRGGPGRVELRMEDAGLPLDSALRRRRGSTLPLLAQILSGLAHLHAHGVLHRDLKPDNVLVDGRGHARIADLGAAAVADTPLGRAPRVTALAYRSPEMLCGLPYGPASDMWALGCVLVDMIEIEREWVRHPAPLFAGRAAADPVSPEADSAPEADAQLRVVVTELVRLYAEPEAGDPSGLRAGAAALRRQGRDGACALRHWDPGLGDLDLERGPRLFPSTPPAWIRQLVRPLLHLTPRRRPGAAELRLHPLLAPHRTPGAAPPMAASDMTTLRRMCSASTRAARATIDECWLQDSPDRGAVDSH